VKTKKMATKIEDIKVEIDQLSEKIARRIEKLEKQNGEEPVMMYRHDPIIHEAMGKIRGLYHKGEEICARYHLGEKTRKFFRDEPAIIRRLELSEENLLH
jgi:regulator of replication initiation timing